MAIKTKAPATNGKAKLTTIEVGKQPVASLGSFTAPSETPWRCEFTLQGTSSMLFHRYVADDGDGQPGRKGAKQVDEPENFVYRCDDGTIGIPGEYVRQAMIHASKYRKDPRNARASAWNLFKAAITMDQELSSLGSAEWDYLDRRRAVIKGAVTRIRPAFQAGWQATFQSTVLLPEYITPALMLDVLSDAGHLIGIGDFRPSFGRFAVVKFELLSD